jgi:catechol 2,3-dioxygenase-like lactoylglutathione lyase family enzyme
MKILSVELATTCISKIKQFYIDNLGFSLQAQSTDTFTMLAGSTNITFISANTEQDPYYHIAMNIPKNKLPEAKKWLLQKGCQLLPTTTIENAGIHADGDTVFFDAVNAESIYFNDPAGNLVELIARQNLENASTNPFAIDNILNISEVAFAFDQNLPEAMQTICSHFDVSPYTGDEKTFQILGDDQGMFILGDTSRAWYPTQRLPEVHPIRMTILGKQPMDLQLKPYPYFIQSIPNARY